MRGKIKGPLFRVKNKKNKTPMKRSLIGGKGQVNAFRGTKETWCEGVSLVEIRNE